MNPYLRLKAADEDNWANNSADYPYALFCAHYYPYTLISASEILPSKEEWIRNKSSGVKRKILKRLHEKTLDKVLLKPRDITLAQDEFETAKRIVKAIGKNGDEMGYVNNREWNPFRKDVQGEFDLIKFINDCGVTSLYLHSKYTDVRSSFKDFVLFFNEILEYNHYVRCHHLLDIDNTLEEILLQVTEMSSDIKYRDRVIQYLSALKILYKESDRVFMTVSGIYTSRGTDARFLFAYKPNTSTVVGCFQVLNS